MTGSGNNASFSYSCGASSISNFSGVDKALISSEISVGGESPIII
ncbi:unnamed protein product [marine sediment metagenome]|uniref:Uncharacterized protein n=1 Tax=marine sediment metagenome TaxID=412755 RepID=X1C0E4_9ZZZZ